MKIYRFQPFSEINDLESLRAEKINPNEIWFSTPDRLNDPLDIKPNIECSCSERGLSKIAKMAWIMYGDHGDNECCYPKNLITNDLLRQIRYFCQNSSEDAESDLKNSFIDRLRHLGVACFTSEWDNQPMWAHYRQESKGFVIEYSADEICIAKNENEIYFSWVKYSNNIERTYLSELLLSPFESAMRIFSAKNIDWAYEKEWRLICLDGGSNMSVPIPTGMKMNSIILGFKSPDEQKEFFKNKCKEWGVSLKEIHIGLDKKFRLKDVFTGGEIIHD